ncbi:MAG TPA: hypothetical protein VN914_07345 [Polyangia bacterium]|nr:hypothetical protein [Polyangia bacterium]
MKTALASVALLATACAPTPPPAAPAPAPPPPVIAVPGRGILVMTSEDGDRSDRLQALSEEACHGLLAVDVEQPPYRPEVPPALSSGQLITARLNVFVGRKGKVFGVKVVEPPNPEQLWGEWMRKLMTWRYRPYLVDGQPVGFSCPVRVEAR